MLRIAINQDHPNLSSISRDGESMLDVVELTIRATLKDFHVHLKHTEWNGNGIVERDEVIQGGEEAMEIVFV